MYARVVRFTDVKSDQIDRIKGEIEGGDGPPPGVNAKGIRVMVDESQGTAVVVLFFDSEEDMKQADAKTWRRWTPARRPAPAPRSIAAR